MKSQENKIYIESFKLFIARKFYYEKLPYWFLVLRNSWNEHHQYIRQCNNTLEHDLHQRNERYFHKLHYRHFDIYFDSRLYSMDSQSLLHIQVYSQYMDHQNNFQYIYRILHHYVLSKSYLIHMVMDYKVELVHYTVELRKLQKFLG